MKRAVKISPSILSADFGAFSADTQRLVDAGADYIHFDVMDGHFVHPITFGPQLLQRLSSQSRVPYDVHLMIDNPDVLVADFAAAGARIITVHPEVCFHLHGVIGHIHQLGKKAGVALNPATSVESVEWVLGDVDRVLVMSVNPGYGGQKFIPSAVDKIAALRAIADREGYRFEIGVDGGITPETAQKVVWAGADVLIAGSFVFSDPGGPGNAIQALRDAALRP